MATFELTARQQMFLGNGNVISKGTPISIHIPMMGIVPGNLFGNPRCRDAVLQQFAMNGINVPPNSPILSRGHWDIKMINK